MNNEAMQAMIDEYGQMIFMIVFDNSSRIHIGYPWNVKGDGGGGIDSIDNIKLETKGGCDFIGFELTPINPTLAREGVKYIRWYPTECIQSVCVQTGTDTKKMIDPWEVR